MPETNQTDRFRQLKTFYLQLFTNSTLLIFNTSSQFQHTLFSQHHVHRAQIPQSSFSLRNWKAELKSFSAYPALHITLYIWKKMRMRLSICFGLLQFYLVCHGPKRCGSLGPGCSILRQTEILWHCCNGKTWKGPIPLSWELSQILHDNHCWRVHCRWPQGKGCMCQHSST